MDQWARELLEEFAHACSTPLMHEDDWSQLYEIAIHMHRQHVVPPPRIVRDFLVNKGCTKQKAGVLSTQLGHFTTLLKRFDERRSGIPPSTPKPHA
jgi:hypothetical protein